MSERAYEHMQAQISLSKLSGQASCRYSGKKTMQVHRTPAAPAKQTQRLTTIGCKRSKLQAFIKHPAGTTAALCADSSYLSRGGGAERLGRLYMELLHPHPRTPWTLSSPGSNKN